jgi:hypothetical protein
MGFSYISSELRELKDHIRLLFIIHFTHILQNSADSEEMKCCAANYYESRLTQLAFSGYLLKRIVPMCTF